MIPTDIALELGLGAMPPLIGALSMRTRDTGIHSTT
jgi:hypothetical protein